jgi:hypothetical protein
MQMLNSTIFDCANTLQFHALHGDFEGFGAVTHALVWFGLVWTDLRCPALPVGYVVCIQRALQGGVIVCIHPALPVRHAIHREWRRVLNHVYRVRIAHKHLLQCTETHLHPGLIYKGYGQRVSER